MATPGPDLDREQWVADLGFDLGWVSGILEGEGCFTWAPLRGGSDCKIPLVQVLMTDRDVVERYAALVGNSVGTQRRSHKGRKDAYRVRTGGRRAAELMTVVYPYMGERRKARIAEILDEYYGQAGVEAWRRKQQQEVAS